MRQIRERSQKYELDQNRLLDMLANVWGQAQPKNVVHFNDRLRLFGILMSIPSNRQYFERLASGVADKNVLDDIAMQPKSIFQKLTFDFCNDLIKVQLPPNAVDVDGWDSLDPNDASRIRIHRDCKSFMCMFLDYMTISPPLTLFNITYINNI